MVPARAGMNDGIVGISWKTCARQNWWCGLCPTDIIKTLGFFYPSFNCKRFFFFLLARTFFRNLCWGYPTQESLVPMESNQGHLVRAQDGELGRPVWAGGARSLWMRFFQSSSPSSVKVWWTQGLAFPTPLEKLCFVIKAELSIRAAQLQSWDCFTQSCQAILPARSISQAVPTGSRRAPLLTQTPIGRLILAASITFIVAVTQGAPKWQRKKVRRLMPALCWEMRGVLLGLWCFCGSLQLFCRKTAAVWG